MALLRYTLLDFLRGRRRTLSSVLGVALAITFLSGTFLAIDSSARATLEGLLDGVPADFTAEGRTGDPVGLQATLLFYPGVHEAAVSVDMGAPNVYPLDDPAEISDTRVAYHLSQRRLVAVDPDNLPRPLQDYDVAGSLDLRRGTVALSRGLADRAGLGLNDTLTFWRAVEGDASTPFPRLAWLNLRVAALMTPPAPQFPTDFALVHLEDVFWVWEELEDPRRTVFATAQIWIERDQLLSPYDVEGSRRNLARFQRGLDAVLAPHNATVNDHVSPVLDVYARQSGVQRPVYVIVSLPVLLLGLYLGAVGIDLTHAERRRELAVLQARGVTPGQVLGHLFLGAVLGGLLATLVGLAMGAALSRLLLSVVNPFALRVVPTVSDFALSGETVVLVTLFAVVFMLLATFRSARRTARLPVAQTLRHYAPGETRIEYRPALDVVLVVLGYLSFAGTLYVATAPGNLVTFLAGDLFPVLLPLGPALLIIGLTRLLTRSTGKVYEWVSRLWRPFLGALHHLVSRNLARNPRRASNMAVIIALGLAFGLFVFAFFGSVSAHQARVLRAEIGADMALTASPEDVAPDPIGINAGGGSYLDAAGNVWEEDAYFNTGETHATSHAIANTRDDPLYQTDRWDPTGDPELEYAIPLEVGDYEVTLHFAEIWPGAFEVGGRVFDVYLEGVLVLDDLDIYAEVGAYTALTKTFAVTVSDDHLHVRFVHVVENPKVSAIEVHSKGEVEFVEELREMDGVSGATTVRRTEMVVYGTRATVFAVEPEAYFAVTRPEAWWFHGMSPETAAALLATEGQVLVTRGLADAVFLEVGDPIPLFRFGYANVTVAGTVRGLPGVVPATEGAEPPLAIYASYASLAPILGFLEGDRVLVDLRPDADRQAVATAVLDRGASEVRVYEDELEAQRSDPFFRSLLGFIALEIGFIVVVLIAGMALVLFAATLERDVEFAAVRARGASGWQAASVLIGEAVSVLLIGLVIGAGLGLLVPYLLLQLLASSLFGPQDPLVPLLFELPLEGWLLLALVPLAMMVTALLVAGRVARMKVARVLKVRGG